MGCQGCDACGACEAAWQHRTVPEIDRYSATWPYVQIAEQLAAEIRSGEREPDSRLPSIVGIVQEWGVNRQTAAKALRLLGEMGLARLSPGMGWEVAPRAVED